MQYTHRILALGTFLQQFVAYKCAHVLITVNAFLLSRESSAVSNPPSVPFADVMLNQTRLQDSVGGSVAHAAERLGEGGLERIVRGDVSLGQLVPPVDASLIVGDVPAGCGLGLPSPTIPNPLGLCSSCNYFSGSIGRDLALHDSVSVRVGHKQSSGSMRMNVVQVELPRCVRGASSW